MPDWTCQLIREVLKKKHFTAQLVGIVDFDQTPFYSNSRSKGGLDFDMGDRVLDFSKASLRRRFYLPSGVKLLFLFLPWVFVAYGVSTLQEFVAFYNNSVEAPARVVFHEASQEERTTADARRLMENTGDWPIPAFLYQHENGVFYIGNAIVDASRWRYRHGELVEVRYNRLRPSQAQPVNILKFWWTPGIFIVGGIAAFLALLLAFYKAENPRAGLIPKIQLYRRKNGSLNLRRN